MTVVAIGAAASPAAAVGDQAPGSAAVQAFPPVAASATTYLVGITASEPRGAYPAELTLSLPAGARLDGRAVAKGCSRRQALALRCPRGSRIAQGSAQLLQTATFSASDPGVPLTVAIDVFAAPTKRPGRLQGLQVISRESVTAIGGSATGFVSPLSLGGGPQLTFGLGLVQRAPEESITFTGLDLRLSARSGRFRLVHNPAQCAGSWVVGLALTGVEPASVSVPCAEVGITAHR